MKNLIKQFSEYFLIGVLAILPILIVIQVVLFVKRLIEDAFFNVYGYVASYLFTSILFLLAVAFLSSIGYSIVKYRRSIIISSVELLVSKIPFLNTIYRVSQKVIDIFSKSDTPGKKEVVYLEYPSPGIWVPAYVTNKVNDWYVLFVPTSPNPTSGFTVMVHAAKVIRSDLNIEEVTSFIVSVGADFAKSGEVIKLPH